MEGDGSEGTRGRDQTIVILVLSHDRVIDEMVLREPGGRTKELICKCQFNKRKRNIIPFERQTFCKQLFSLSFS